jgi:hypothetical protein
LLVDCVANGVSCHPSSRISCCWICCFWYSAHGLFQNGEINYYIISNDSRTKVATSTHVLVKSKRNDHVASLHASLWFQEVQVVRGDERSRCSLHTSTSHIEDPHIITDIAFTNNNQIAPITDPTASRHQPNNLTTSPSLQNRSPCSQQPQPSRSQSSA